MCSSKHLKGQLDPPVSDGNVFCIKAGQLDPPVSDGNVFCIRAGQLDPPVSALPAVGRLWPSTANF